MSKAMFKKTEFLSSNGKTYTNWICNPKRGGCGEQFFTADKHIHRDTCFKEIPVRLVKMRSCPMHGHDFGPSHGCFVSRPDFAKRMYAA